MNEERNNNLIYTSVSRVNAYNTCQQQYYYTYEDEEAEYIETDIHRRGHFVHETLDQWAKMLMEDSNGSNEQTPAVKLLHESYRRARKFKRAVILSESSKDRYYEAKRCVELFGKHIKDINNVPNIISSEKSIKFVVDDTVALKVIIDRVDRIDKDTIEVVDYKVTKWKQYLTGFQLLIYALALMSERNDFSQIKSKYVVLDFVNDCYDEKPFIVSEATLTRAKKKLIKTAKEIKESKASNIWKPKQSKLCKACSFFMRCRMENRKYFNSW